MYPSFNAHLHTVPSLPRMIHNVKVLCDNKDLRGCERLMQHLFNSVPADEYHIVYHHGTPVARIAVHTYMRKQFHQHGVYQCLLNS